MNIEPESRVGEIAARYPLATRVFARHRIDFCCGGGVALAEACRKRDLDVSEVLVEIRRTLDTEAPETEPWNQAPIAELVRHIVDDYHGPLREELPRLEEMARKVARVHGDKDPERLSALLETFLALRSELDEHLRHEESELFPQLLAHGLSSDDLLSSLVEEHETAGRALERIRELTDDYRVPEQACNTWRALWHGLAALEESLHRHIHLENNILFRRVAA